MSCVWFWMAEIGTPAAMRPMTGIDTVRLSIMCDGGGARSLLRGRPAPSMTLGWNPMTRRSALGGGFEFSGSFRTSMARARCGRRRMKPRSTSAVIKR